MSSPGKGFVWLVELRGTQRNNNVIQEKISQGKVTGKIITESAESII